ncbi:hypothetical protein GBAR_LOCUS17865 [Geodia barretti]|uniref:SAM domain-containing protein n=1 Tax=Geodia barretti TaxID=519541 RepID=A0AA35WYQ4_GEOBA|nr:hypothetical protein GBAR_LOCUS17865 [Geodia barretti]
MARRFDGLSTDHSTSASQGGNSLSLSESILDNIFEHKIDGEVFLSLNDENLREIAPLLGDRLKIKRLISETLVKLDTMLNEFCSLTGAEECKFKENWGKYEKLVFKYAPLEQKKSLKIFCISIMLRSVTMLVDRTAAYTLDLLWALLSTNRSSGQPLISIFEGESLDIEECIAGLNTTAPCIAAFGVTRDNIADVKVIVETDNILPVNTLSTSIHVCFACYYIFNISFPPSYKHILLFLEKYVYGLKSSQKLPMSVVLVHDGMERVLDT